MGGSGPVQSSTQTSEPWAELKPGIIDTLNNAKNLYSQPYTAYSGQTVAGPADSTMAGYSLGSMRAMLGAPDLSAARGSTADISGGAMFGYGPTATNPWLNHQAMGLGVGANPYVQQASDWTGQVMMDNANNMAQGHATGTAAQNDALFSRHGAYGSSQWAQKQSADAAALAQQIGQMGNQYNLQRSQLGAQDYQNSVNQAMQAGQQQQGAYANDVSNILQSNALAGQLSGDDWRAADYLRSIGSQQEGYQQKLLDSSQSQWQQAMNAPYAQMQGYANLLSQFAGTGSTGTQQIYGSGQSPLGLGIGAGLLGLGAYNAMK